MKIKLHKLSIIIIISISFLIRLIGLEKADFWLDESFSYFFSKMPISFIFYEDTWTPLFYLLTRFHDPDIFFLRLISVILGIGSLIMIYWIAKELFGNRVAIISTIFASLNLALIKYSQLFRGYSLGIFLVLCSFYVFIVMEDKFSDKFIYWLFHLLAFYTHYFCLLIIPIEIIFNPKKAKKITHTIIYTFSIFILPDLMNILNKLSKLATSKLYSPPLNIENIISIINFSLGGMFLLLITLITIIIISNPFNIKIPFKTPRKELRLLIASLIPTIILITISVVYPILSVRYIIFFLPLSLIAIASLINILDKKIIYIIVIVYSIVQVPIIIDYNLSKDTELQSAYQFLKDNNIETAIHYSTFSYFPIRFYDTGKKITNLIYTQNPDYLRNKYVYGTSIINKNEIINKIPEERFAEFYDFHNISINSSNLILEKSITLKGLTVNIWQS